MFMVGEWDYDNGMQFRYFIDGTVDTTKLFKLMLFQTCGKTWKQKYA